MVARAGMKACPYVPALLPTPLISERSKGSPG